MGTVWGQQPTRKFVPAPAPLLPLEQAWLVTLPALPAAGGALDDTTVYIPLEEGGTVALARGTGRIVWTNPLSVAWPPLLTPGAVVLVTSTEAAAVSRASGEVIWRVPLAARPLAAGVVGGDRVVIPIEGGSLVALDADDGSAAWSLPVDGLMPPASLAADDQAVYVTMAGARVAAAALASGKLLWTAQFSGTLGVPAVARDRVLVGSTSNAFYALDADSGRLEWMWSATMIGGDVIGAGVDDDVVYFASLDNILHAVNRGNGNQRWKQTLPTRPLFPPRAFGGIVAVFGVSPAIATFNAKTGAALGTYVVPTAAGAAVAGLLQGAPLVDAPLRPFRVAVVIITADGRAIGLRPTEMMFREAAPVPLTALPGRPLTRERSPVAATP